MEEIEQAHAYWASLTSEEQIQIVVDALEEVYAE